MTGFLRAIYSPRAFDLMFAFLGVMCLPFLVRWSNDAVPAIAPATDPLLKGAALTGAAIVGALLATVSTRFDQKWTDDYMFQTLCKSALMTIFGTIFATVLYAIVFANGFGQISSQGMLALLCAVWAACYFIVRVRGTRL